MVSLNKSEARAECLRTILLQNGLTQVFGGFLAYVGDQYPGEALFPLTLLPFSQGISFYDGRILAPYKIIYIVLGGLAIVVGICVLIWLPDSPVHAQFLTKEERIAALERVRDDQGGTENKNLKKGQVFEALTDIRTWLIVLTTLLSKCVFFFILRSTLAYSEVFFSECPKWRSQ